MVTVYGVVLWDNARVLCAPAIPMKVCMYPLITSAAPPHMNIDTLVKVAGLCITRMSIREPYHIIYTGSKLHGAKSPTHPAESRFAPGKADNSK